MSREAPPESDPILSARLLLYALEAVGDPGAAEALIAQAAGRAFRWSKPAEPEAVHRALLEALTAVSHGPLNRCPRPPLPPLLRPEGTEFDEEVERTLAELPGRERAALYLVLVEGMSYEQCAAVLGTTPTNAGTLVYRARLALRARLVGAPPEPGGASDSSLMPSTASRISKVLRTDCSQAGPYLSADIDGELSEKQRAVLAPHLEGCPVCAEERARMEQTSAALRSHWEAVVRRLSVGGWSRRAERAAVMGSSAVIEVARLRRLRVGSAAACLAILVVAGALWSALRGHSDRAVLAVRGECLREGRVIEAKGPTELELCDGSRASMSPGAVLEAERIPGVARPRLRLLAGSVRFEVFPGGADLLVETAIGRAAASSGAFRARLTARDGRGRRIEMRFPSRKSLARGEHLSLAVESESDRLVLGGLSGPDLPVAPGALAAVPAGEQPRPLAVPGRWVPLERSGGDPAARRGGALAGEGAAGLLVLSGGRRGPGGGPLAGLWACDPLLGVWMEFPGAPGAKPAPRPRGQVPGALLPDPRGDGLWLYEGRVEGQPPAGLWHLHSVEAPWRRVDFTVSKPPPSPRKKSRKPISPLGREGAALAASRARGGIVLFGGLAAGRKQGDTWFFDAARKNWRPLAVGGPQPEARYGAALASDLTGERLYLFGGRSAAGAMLDDTWVLELPPDGPGRWRYVKMDRRPPARSGAVMACEGTRGRLVLYGGRKRLGGPLGDTWVLAPATSAGPEWNRLTSPVSPPAEEFGAPAMAWHPGAGSFFLWCRDRLWSLRLK